MLVINFVTFALGAVYVLAAPIVKTIIARSPGVSSTVSTSPCQTARLRSGSSAVQLNHTLDSILPLLNNTSTSNVLASSHIKFAGDSSRSVQSDIDSLAAANASTIGLPSALSLGFTQFHLDGTAEGVRSAQNGTNSATLKELLATALDQVQTWTQDANEALDTCAASIFAKEIADDAAIAQTRVPLNASVTAAVNPKSTN